MDIGLVLLVIGLLAIGLTQKIGLLTLAAAALMLYIGFQSTEGIVIVPMIGASLYLIYDVFIGGRFT